MFMIFMIISAFIIGCWLSPFIYWSAYFRLWRHILFDWEKGIPLRTRCWQAGFLLKYLFLSPIRTLFWYMDELLFPAYKRQNIQPVFIVGLPRSGTTFLHRTLGVDQDTFMAVRYFEWTYPYIFLLKLIKLIRLEEKLKNISYWTDTKVGDTGQKMHEMNLFTLEEDACFFQDHFLYGYAVFDLFPYPKILPYLTDFPSLPQKVQKYMIETQQKVIKKILYLRGMDKIYLSKHIDNDVRMSLLRLYPDARFIALFRPVNKVLSSWILIHQLAVLNETGIDPSSIPAWEEGHINTIRKNSSRLMEHLENQIAPEKQLRLSYDQLTKNIVSTFRYIYAWLGLDMSDAYLRYLEEIQQAQKIRQRGYDYKQKQFEGFEKLNDFSSKVDQSHRTALNAVNSELRMK